MPLQVAQRQLITVTTSIKIAVRDMPFAAGLAIMARRVGSVSIWATLLRLRTGPSGLPPLINNCFRGLVKGVFPLNGSF